jgi:hypothetical protein
MSVPDHTIAALLNSLETSADRCWIVRGNDMPEAKDPADLSALDSDAGDSIVFCRGLPWLSESCSHRWLGDRLFCFPDGVPHRRRIAIVSSRLRQRLDQETWWFDLLRTLTLRMTPDGEALLIADDTAPCDAVARSATLFGRTVIHFLPHEHALHHEASLGYWIETCLRMPEQSEDNAGDRLRYRVSVSPELDAGRHLSSSFRAATDEVHGLATSAARTPGSQLTGSQLPDSIPLRDRLLFAAAEEIYVFSCRANGTVAQLLKQHCNDGDRQKVPLLIASNSDGELPTTVKDLGCGWVPWLLQPYRSEETAGKRVLATSNESTPLHRIEKRQSDDDAGPLIDAQEWLHHWTRPARGPWPGETANDYLDAQILRTGEANRSALATLLRIVASGRLIASAEGIRGGHSVVAFTHVPLKEFRKRRLFRKHRHRFDFEPWGIAVQKTSLLQYGLRPVLYGDDKEWNELHSDDRPFFQKASQGGASSDFDECEWRIVGDLDLKQLPSSSVVVFADNDAAAAVLREQCGWKVVVVPDAEA